MTRHLLALSMVFAVLGVPAGASACRWFGTQLECALGTSELVVGTQAAAGPTYAEAFRPLRFQGVSGDARPVWPVRIDLQNIGADPSLCRKIGNETYCY